PSVFSHGFTPGKQLRLLLLLHMLTFTLCQVACPKGTRFWPLILLSEPFSHVSWLVQHGNEGQTHYFSAICLGSACVHYNFRIIRRVSLLLPPYLNPAGVSKEEYLQLFNYNAFHSLECIVPLRFPLLARKSGFPSENLWRQPWLLVCLTYRIL